MLIDDKRQDLIQEGIDVAIRFGTLPDSSAVARLIGRWPLVVAAAPSYLATYGTPEMPEALDTHVFVIAGPVAGREPNFRQGDRQVGVRPHGHVAIDGAEVAVIAVRAGARAPAARLAAKRDRGACAVRQRTRRETRSARLCRSSCPGVAVSLSKSAAFQEQSPAG